MHAFCMLCSALLSWFDYPKNISRNENCEVRRYVIVSSLRLDPNTVLRIGFTIPKRPQPISFALCVLNPLKISLILFKLQYTINTVIYAHSVYHTVNDFLLNVDKVVEVGLFRHILLWIHRKCVVCLSNMGSSGGRIGPMSIPEILITTKCETNVRRPGENQETWTAPNTRSHCSVGRVFWNATWNSLLLSLHGASSGCGWRKWSPSMDGGCVCIE
jgi:hypothetical protein